MTRGSASRPSISRQFSRHFAASIRWLRMGLDLAYSSSGGRANCSGIGSASGPKSAGAHAFPSWPHPRTEWIMEVSGESIPGVRCHLRSFERRFSESRVIHKDLTVALDPILVLNDQK